MDYLVWKTYRVGCRTNESKTRYLCYKLPSVIRELKARYDDKEMLRSVAIDVFDNASNLVAYKEYGRVNFIHRGTR